MGNFFNLRRITTFSFIWITLITFYTLLLFLNTNSIPLFNGDELVYVSATRFLMTGQLGLNNHPLLAKTVWLLVVDFFYILTGTDYPIFWRVGTILLSLGTLLVFYKVARLFFSKYLSLCCVILLAVDPMYFVLSRMVQLDVPALFFFIVFLYYFFLFSLKKSTKSLYLSSIFLGLSLATKLFAIPVLLSLPFLIAYYSERSFKQLMVKLTWYYFLVAAGFTLGNSLFFSSKSNFTYFQYVYLLIKSQSWRIPPPGYSFPVSPALSWFVIPQMLIFYRVLDPQKHLVQTITAFQNPIMLILTWFTIFAALYQVIKGKNQHLLIPLVFFFFLYLPWSIGIHLTYYYYILPVLPLVILLFMKIVNSSSLLKNNLKLIMVSFTGLNLGIFLVFLPVLVGWKISYPLEKTLVRYSLYQFPKRDTTFCQQCSPISYNKHSNLQKK